MLKKMKRGNFILNSLKISIVLSALDAVSIGPVPLTWIAVWIPLITAVISRVNFKAVSAFLYILIIWSIVVQCLSLSSLLDTSILSLRMPQLSTTPYPVFIILRFIPLLMLVAVIAMTSSIKDRSNELYEFILNTGFWVAVIALYVYFAQIFDLPDIPRSRLGTDGLEVTAVSFTYSFHRALGTFREPSGMAAWLMLPFFLSLFSSNWRTYLIGGAILLSGSMSAFVAITAGSVLALIFVTFRNSKSVSLLLKIPIKFGLILAISSLIFWVFVSKGGDYHGLLSVVQDRLTPVVAGGIAESDRGYVYDFAAHIGIPVVGFGLGNSNLILTTWLGGDAVAGMLSLYLNILISLGFVGVLLLLPFLLRPLVKPIKFTHPFIVFSCYGGYFSWLIIFTVHSAEFPLMFAVSYGLVSSVERLRPEALGINRL